MNAPLIWVIFPLLVSALLLLLNRHTRLSAWLATGVCLFLTLLAAFVKIGVPLQIAVLNIEIKSTLTILGRQFVILSSDQGLLTMLYLMGTIWFAASQAARANRLFAPMGLAMIALLVAASSVEPFLYAALIVEMAILLSLPMISPPGQPVGRGVMRYLIFQTLALPFILMAGWAFRAIEANPANEGLYVQAAILLGLGLAMWLAVFPFFTWVPMLADETHPYVIGFILSVLPTVILFYGLDFLNTYAWLRTDPLLPQVLQVIGALMVITGGVWMALQEKLVRIFAYAAIMQTGFSLLSLSLQSEIGLNLFATQFLPRLLSFWLWTFVLAALLQQEIPLTTSGVRGLWRQSPALTAGIMAAWLSLAGLPLLAGFPIRQALLEELAAISLPAAIGMLLGIIGILFSALRAASSLMQLKNAAPIELHWQQNVLLITGTLVLLLIGLFPNMFLHGLASLVESYKNLP